MYSGNRTIVKNIKLDESRTIKNSKKERKENK